MCPDVLCSDVLEDVTPSDPGKVYTRLLVNKYDFGKIIGKGGQTITALKSQTGCHVKGINDTDDETRMVRGVFLTMLY